jgi:hypothetical protein
MLSKNIYIHSPNILLFIDLDLLCYGTDTAALVQGGCDRQKPEDQ